MKNGFNLSMEEPPDRESQGLSSHPLFIFLNPAASRLRRNTNLHVGNSFIMWPSQTDKWVIVLAVVLQLTQPNSREPLR